MVVSFLAASRIQSAPCSTGPQQQEAEPENVAKLKKASDADVLLADYASPIVFLLKEKVIKSFTVFRRLSPVDCHYKKICFLDSISWMFSESKDAF